MNSRSGIFWAAISFSLNVPSGLKIAGIERIKKTS